MNISDEYRKILASVFEATMPYEHIYHYTSPETAFEILGTTDKCGFCCTHYGFLNDDGEFSTGIDIVLSWLRFLSTKSKYGALANFVGRIETILRPKVKDAIENCYTPWVLSFCRDWDSLSQWASYTDRKKGGYAIGVNFDKLIETITPLRSIEWIDPRDIWIVAPCVYVDVHSKSSSRKSEYAILDRLLKYYGGIELLKSKDAVNRFVIIAILFASLIKSKDFRFENEWRVVHLTDNTFDYQKMEVIGGKPRICLPNKCDSLIGKLVVSHHGNSAYLKSMADLLAKKYRLKVRESKTSYTGM